MTSLHLSVDRISIQVNVHEIWKIEHFVTEVMEQSGSLAVAEYALRTVSAIFPLWYVNGHWQDH